RRAQIHRARTERVFKAASHEARQIRATAQHLRGRRPARPFLLGADSVDAAPAEAVAANADPVSQCLAPREDEIEPPFAGSYDNGAWRIPALEIDKLPGDRTCGCITGAKIHEVAGIKELGESRLRTENKGGGNQKSQNARHYFLASIDLTVSQAIIRL